MDCTKSDGFAKKQIFKQQFDMLFNPRKGDIIYVMRRQTMSHLDNENLV